MTRVLVWSRWRGYGRRPWRVRLLWEPRDVWVGVYRAGVFDANPETGGFRRTYVCVVPCLPLIVDRVVRRDASENGAVRG